MNIEVVQGQKRHHITAQKGANLMKCLLEAGLMEGAECGGRGVCGKCAVRIVSGTPESIDEGAKPGTSDGKILSCRYVVGDDDIILEMASALDDINRKVRLPNLQATTKYTDGPIAKKYIELTQPSLTDQKSDMERILAQIGKNTKYRPSLLLDLPDVLRKAGFKVTAVLVNDELIAIEPGDTTNTAYGFILDVGTTTVAIYLVDMIAGVAIDAEGLANPQRVYGADVLSRITAANTPELRRKIQRETTDGISAAMRTILKRHDIDENQVYAVTAVGNTTMSHMLLGVDPTNLAMAPFIPCYRGSVATTGHGLGLAMHPEGLVNILPNISGYVGSDTMGVIVATKMWEQKGFSIAVDIGTNGEIVLGYKGWVLACSAAAGPAFEGSHIQQGMRAGEGAIEKVAFVNDDVKLTVIGTSVPQGICGSGLIDAVAEMVRTGVIDTSGKFATEKSPAFDSPLCKRIRTNNEGMHEFVLAYAGEHGNKEDLVITQKDIRELQLAKAAIAAGIQVLLKEPGIDSSKVDRVYLAGAFGNYLDREKACALGLFPGIPVEKIIPIGNAAAEGAGKCLLSAGERKMAERMAAFVKPVELSTRTDFNDLWIKEIPFPKPE